MKIAESWLRDWVDPDISIEELAELLTMAGHEVDSVSVEGRFLAGVEIAEVVTVEAHPDADRLRVCQVTRGVGKPIQVVCGAPNVTVGMKSVLAKPGLTLSNGAKLKKAKIRGVASAGMLCSAAELGLGEDSDGILELAADAPVGTALVDYLGLPDTILDLDLTPNRGDCFSILGIARDVSALTGAPLRQTEFPEVPASISDCHPVEVEVPAGCPNFAGRVIRGIDSQASSPMWMRERLRRSGLRPIHPVVDVTNFVMLELGQPLHAYDLNRVQGAIRPRLGQKEEKLTLLDEKLIKVREDTLVISDDSGAIGLAGIMGGMSTAVTADTIDVFFEAAYWPPDFMAGRARSYGLHTDASLRFERGVDAEGQSRAIERATALLLEIAGGEPGPLVVNRSDSHIPDRKPILLRRERLATLLGKRINDGDVRSILENLHMAVTENETGWLVQPPSFRFDIQIEADLVEEVARIHGYDAIPEVTAVALTSLPQVSESSVGLDNVAATLVARDYREVISYSFIDAETDKLFSGKDSELILSNPISAEMSVMRSSLVPGLLRNMSTNLARQQDRVRFFEVGKSFHGKLGSHCEILRIAGVVSGAQAPEQWSIQSRPVDFFDIKSDVLAIVGLSDLKGKVEFVPSEHPAMQPGQAAEMKRDGDALGVIGKLHPRIAALFELKREAFFFELDADVALASSAPSAVQVSKYPSLRRDIAIVVDEDITASELLLAVEAVAPETIKNVRIFDIYRGPGIEAGRKSVALGLILQDTSRTLTDRDADSVVASAVQNLEKQFAAELRD